MHGGNNTPVGGYVTDMPGSTTWSPVKGMSIVIK
jgi:hypothetical protein